MQASAARGSLLTVAFCLGLGLPFVAVGLAFRQAAGALAFLRSHYGLVVRLGGLALVVLGLLLVTGVWDSWSHVMRGWATGFGTVI